ncbi:MAG: lamin tail domain-containing protein [Myxococcota bacterium]
MSRLFPLFSVVLTACTVRLAPVDGDGADAKMQQAAGASAVPSGLCETAELCADELGFTDVYVSEVMSDPTACTDATGEWIEVANRTDYTVDLDGAVLVDGSSGARATLHDLPILAPHSYVVLGRGTPASFCGPVADATYGTAISLNNTGDSLRLEKSTGALIDLVLSWPAAVPGTTYETSPADAWSWSLGTGDMGAGERGSPGTGLEEEGYVRPLSEVDPGDLEISEIMGNPTCAYDTCEWVEIKNWTGVAIDLTGLELVDAGGSRGAVEQVIGKYERIVVGRYDAAGWDDATVTPTAFWGTLGINNTDEQLFLMDGDRTLFQSPLFSAMPSGESWALIGWNPGDLASWSTGAATPGY